ncbi:RSP_7527 family protein [Marinomonas ostreistagni]|uniref:RSP_7527 family protein n=1 Tax=Marinomonas ostreistagni TaxID=359209 RepID=UPI00194F6F22|nr:hypothetical protein [Marinomonas ostreistagni]MBM6552268.1 hypothetical protein [Marinomonas ostreistagni]
MNRFDFDNLDTDYYVERGYELRRQYVAQASKSLVARIKALFTSSTPRPSTPLQGTPAHS